jgi:hypothetical protein
VAERVLRCLGLSLRGGRSRRVASGDGGEGVTYGIVAKDDVYGGGSWRKMVKAVELQNWDGRVFKERQRKNEQCDVRQRRR